MYVGYRLFLCAILIISLSSGLTADERIQKCAENGEYCQHHDECCSNRCFTYLYRCTKNNQLYPYPFLGINHNPIVTLDDFVAQEFGKNIDATTEVVPILTQRFSNNNQEPETDISLQEPNQNAQSFTIGTDPQAVSTMAPNAVESCKEIGLKCYHNDECCSNRCHGFLHQCVT